MITEQKFVRYVALQYMGFTNMADLSMVERVTGIHKPDLLEIQKNYQSLWSKYFGDGTRLDLFIYQRIIKHIYIPNRITPLPKPKTKKKPVRV